MKVGYLVGYVFLWMLGAWCIGEGVQEIAGEGWGLVSLGVLLLVTLFWWFRDWRVIDVAKFAERRARR